MPSIGTFQKTDAGYSGRIRTLAIDAEVVLIPAKKSDTENAPDFRIHLGDKDGPEVGAAWKETGEKAGDYLSFQLDDPTFVAADPREPVPERRRRQRLDAPLEPSETAQRAGLTAMRYPANVAIKPLIPMFAKEPRHPAVPLSHRTAGARSAGQGRPSAGACALPFTAASTLASLRLGGGRAVPRYAALLLVGVLSLSQYPAIAMAQPTTPVMVVPGQFHAAHVAEASQRFGMPEHWIAAVLRAESAGDPRAISSAGAMGLMQVMPDTWAELRGRYGLARDPFDARDNIHAGTAYLREMWDRYGNVAAMLAAYNAGPGRYDDYLSTGRILPAETRAYVAALVPVLGGAAASEPNAPAPPRPLDWREAPLFVMRPHGAQAVAAPPPEAHSGGGSADAEPQTDGMFVARASAGTSPW